MTSVQGGRSSASVRRGPVSGEVTGAAVATSGHPHRALLLRDGLQERIVGVGELLDPLVLELQGDARPCRSRVPRAPRSRRAPPEGRRGCGSSGRRGRGTPGRSRAASCRPSPSRSAPRRNRGPAASGPWSRSTPTAASGAARRGTAAPGTVRCRTPARRPRTRCARWRCRACCATARPASCRPGRAASIFLSALVSTRETKKLATERIPSRLWPAFTRSSSPERYASITSR